MTHDVQEGQTVLVPWGLTQVPGIVRRLYGPPGHPMALVALLGEDEAGEEAEAGDIQERTVSVPVSALIDAMSDHGSTLTRDPESGRQRTKLEGKRRSVVAGSKKQSRDVVKSPKGGWDVKQPGKNEPVSHHKTQANADRAAKSALRRQGGGEVRVHGRDGRIRDSDTVPPARDPNPPRDAKH